MDGIFDRGNKIDNSTIIHDLHLRTGFYMIPLSHLSRYDYLTFR